MSMILVLEGVPSDGVQRDLVSSSGASLSQNGSPGLGVFAGTTDDSDSFQDEFESLDDFDEFEDSDFDPNDDFEEGFGTGSLSENSISLEKTWHGIHYLLTGEAWSGEGWRAFLVSGGQEQGEDEGYGPARVFTATEVAEIAQGLEVISGDDLWTKFNADEMTGEEIYPDIWDEDEEDLREEYLEYFEQLKSFVSRLAENGEAMRIALT